MMIMLKLTFLKLMICMIGLHSLIDADNEVVIDYIEADELHDSTSFYFIL